MKEEIRTHIEAINEKFGADGLRTASKIIGGKLGHRSLSPVDQRRLQAARKAKRDAQS